ncbi:uncharacterized protein F5147DRAFT_657627 [Suillus discolor]|uniref:Uncharacterized protein n=1 Tax=Suillus discolor TaxID=1912936 RepID=A0A9P7JNR4_9AGAM|nr:uncharacterized protein F5147DRAFT_657627 [Suillus discolor]KAG2092652.1 hypothetical protein F5147DRAFT_657627 [Suillus discolor]
MTSWSNFAREMRVDPYFEISVEMDFVKDARLRAAHGFRCKKFPSEKLPLPLVLSIVAHQNGQAKPSGSEYKQTFPNSAHFWMIEPRRYLIRFCTNAAVGHAIGVENFLPRISADDPNQIACDLENRATSKAVTPSMGVGAQLKAHVPVFAEVTSDYTSTLIAGHVVLRLRISEQLNKGNAAFERCTYILPTVRRNRETYVGDPLFTCGRYQRVQAHVS